MTDEKILDYLNQSSSELRVNALNEMRSNDCWLPISMANDLICLNISDVEKMAIIRATSNKNNLAFEDFLTRHIPSWNQNIASCGLWEWALRSESILWHRTMTLSQQGHLSQRMDYTLLDLAWYGAGSEIIKSFQRENWLEEMSPAFLALLFYRALQWDIEDDGFKDIAKHYLSKVYGGSAPAERSIPYFLAYLYRFDFSYASSIISDESISGIWTQFNSAVIDEIESEKRLSAFASCIKKKATPSVEQDILKSWPMLWERHRISAKDLAWIFLQLSEGKFEAMANKSWEIFAGIPSPTLIETLRHSTSTSHFVKTIRVIGNLIHISDRPELLEVVRGFVAQCDDPASFIEELPRRISTGLNTSFGKGTFGKLMDEQQKTISSGSHPFVDISEIYIDSAQNIDEEAKSRQAFFDVVYRNKKNSNVVGDDMWSKFLSAWNSPQAKNLDELSMLSRQSPALYQLAYIEVLGQFSGIDAAALKLLDFIRSSEESILKLIIKALSGINTNRSIQELVAFLTRPNVSFNLQMDIAHVLKSADLSLLQSELRSAINDLRYEADGGSPVWELKEAISSLLLTDTQEEIPPTQADSTPTTEMLDAQLEGRLLSYGLLSGEARRALRTAQFFHLQVANSGNLNTIDLSPAIDMQYKALELSFREKFEEVVGHLIKTGGLQRKLDVIGYARPIPRSMDEFEKYIESLPIVDSIPFFSRFKLRKMLRAICQYRPGRRFTLDGLKAFALFFICFSRKNCRYGLNDMLPLEGMTDQELFVFCKELHIFQDFRNRAAHEGFHPDASNDLEGIWKNTASIIEKMVHVESILNGSRSGNLQTGA